MASIPELIHGSKPKVAPFISTDPIEMLKKLLSGEITDWPQIQQLGELFQNTQLDQLSNVIPNIRDLFKMGGETTEQTQKNALALEKGQLPPEDIAAIFRTSAAQNLGSGTLFGGMGQANTLRNIGVGTLQGQIQGDALATSAGNAAQRWMQMAQGTMLPASAYMYSPEWFTEFMGKQAAAKRDVKQQKYNQDAQPDRVWSGIVGTAINLIGAYLGHGMGGGNSFQAGGPQVPTGQTLSSDARVSQYPGVMGSVSNWLGGGGSFEAGRGLPGAFGYDPGPTMVPSPNIGSTAPYQPNIPPNFSSTTPVNNTLAGTYLQPSVFNQQPSIYG